MRAVRDFLSWFLALFLIAVILHWTVHPWPDPVPGEVIFFDLPGEHNLFHQLAMKSGLDLFEPSGRYVFGISELFAALCLLITPVRRLGAILACVLFLVLIGLHVSPWLGMDIVSVADEDVNDGGASFYLTVSALTAGLILLVVHPKSR
jgi:hypothetical protein